MNAPSLAVFKAKLDKGLEEPGIVGGIPAHGWMLELDQL